MEKAGIWVLILSILFVLILFCALAFFLPLEKWELWNIFEKFVNQHPLFTNIIGAFIGIICIFIILRPRFIIEENLEEAPINNRKYLKIRVRNLGLFPINTIRVQILFYRWKMQEGKKVKITKKINLKREDTPILPGIFPREADPTYGCVSLLPLEELKNARFLQNSEEIVYEGITCRVSATHAISGLTYVRERIFKREQVDQILKQPTKEENNYQIVSLIKKAYTTVH